MTLPLEAHYTAALGLAKPWVVGSVELNTAKRRIDFSLACTDKRLSCPHCNAAEQPIHDRVAKSWRHLDFFQFEAWLKADVPRVKCSACGKTTQLEVPWARSGSGFTLLFEALSLSLCKELPVAQAGRLLRTSGKRLWRCLSHYVSKARALDDMSDVRFIGIDETSVKKGHQYITVVHDLDKKRLLFACAGRDHQAVHDFTADLALHKGSPQAIEHVCMDMSTAFIKGVGQALPQAAISYDRFHVAMLAGRAMEQVRRDELKASPYTVREVFSGPEAKKTLKAMLWGMRRNEAQWSERQALVMKELKASSLQSARAWQLKTALQDVYAQARSHNDPALAAKDLKAWLSWAARSRLMPFKVLAKTIKTYLAGVLSGMLDGRSNAYVEAMNGLLQQAKVAARGFRTTENFICIAYLRMSKLQHLPSSPLVPAIASKQGTTTHRV